jgi:hypothetical protein
VAGLLLAEFAIELRGIEETRGEASQAAMGADGAAEAGEGGAQIVGRAPAHASGRAGGRAESRAASRPTGAAVVIHSRGEMGGGRLGEATLPFTVSLPFLYRKSQCGRSNPSHALAFPVLNLVVVFIIRDVADRRGELDRAGGLLNLAAQVAGHGVELGRGESLDIASGEFALDFAELLAERAEPVGN